MEKDNKEEKETIISLNESNLSWAGKMFFTSLAAKLAHDTAIKLPIKVKGTPAQINAIAEAIFASKKFQEELSKPDATIASVYEKLQLKNLTREKFRKLTGHDLPL